MTTEKQKCVIILGMHGSGTGVLAGCLNLLGIKLGHALRQGTDSSAFVNQDIVVAHEILLRDIGFAWDMVGSLPNGWQESEAAHRAGERLRRIMKEQLLGKGPFAVNDPRMCRLMPLWAPLLDTLDVEPEFVLLVRHPMEVAMSLKARNGLDLLQGHLLWLVHTRDALAVCRDRKYVVSTYDRLIADPIRCLDDVGRCLKIDFPKAVNLSQQQILNFIRPELKHQHEGAVKKDTEGQFDQYVWLYDQFRLDHAKFVTGATEIQESEALGSHLIPDSAIQEFPLLKISDSITQREAAPHAAAMFNNMQSLISRYERASRDARIKQERRLLLADHRAENLYAEVHLEGTEEEKHYFDQLARKILLAPGEWQSITISLNDAVSLRQKRLIFRPLNTKGEIHVSAINILDAANRETLWSASPESGFEQCTVQGTAFVLDRSESLVICSTGNDPQILLPELSEIPDRPLQLEVWIKPSRELRCVRDRFQELRASFSTKEKELESERERLAAVGRRLEDVQKQLQEQEEVAKQYARKRDEARQESEKLKGSLSTKEKELESERERLQEQEGLTREYFQELSRSEQARVETRKQLQDQEAMTREYFQELSRAEQEQERLNALTQQVNSENEQLNNRLHDLQENFNKLLKTRRWKMGNAMGRGMGLMFWRRKKPISVMRMEEIFTWVNQRRYQFPFPETGSISASNGRKLVEWMDQLEKFYQILIRSGSFRMGNAFAASERLFRPWKKKRLVADQMQRIFIDFQDWKQNALYKIQPGTEISVSNLRKLQKWIERLEKLVDALLNSRRWKMGRWLCLRSGNPKAVEEMLEIFKEYDESG